MVNRKNTRAIGYVRVSVDGINKVSPDAQREAIQHYVAAKGWDLVDVVVERGKSAGEGKRRPKFDGVLERITAGEADALVVYRLDRATRSTVDFAKWWADLASVGAEFVSVTEGFDTSTGMGKAMLKIAVVFAELERETIAERVRDTYRHKRANGAPPSGYASYGYRREPGTDALVIEPNEAHWVRQIVVWIVDGVSLREVVRRLNDAGVPKMKHARGDNGPERVVVPWNLTSMRMLIVSPTIAGLRVDPDTGVLQAGSWPAIVEPDEWKRVGAVLKDPRRRMSTKREPTLLSGLAICGKCGAPMRPHRPQRKGTRPLRYRCIRSESHPDACSGVSIDAADAEGEVTTALFRAVEGRTLAPVETNGDDEVSVLQEQLDDLAHQYGSGECSFSEWQSARRPLLDRIAAAERVVTRRRRDVKVNKLLGGGNLADVWEDLPIDDKRAVLRQVIAAVTIEPAVTRGVVKGRVRMVPAS